MNKKQKKIIMQIIKYCIIAAAAVYLYYKKIKGLILKNNDLYVCYGVTSQKEVRTICKLVANGLSLGADKKDLELQLLEIAQAESRLGTIKYNPNRGYGIGIWQFDKIAFVEIQQQLSKKPAILKKCEIILQYNPLNKEYQDLATHALMACVYARLYLYFRIPEKVGSTPEERARQWKKYYNTIKGAGSETGYLNAIKYL